LQLSRLKADGFFDSVLNTKRLFLLIDAKKVSKIINGVTHVADDFLIVLDKGC